MGKRASSWLVGAVLAVLLSLVLVVTACGKEATPAPAPTAAPAVATPAPAVGTPAPGATPAPTAVPAVQPKSGGIIRLWNRADPPYFDPMGTLSIHVALFTHPVFSQLVRFDPENEDLEDLVPDLAERWEVSSDGLTVTFFLRKGVKWHDGEDFNATDVKYSLEKMADPKRSSISSSLIALDSVEIVDDYTVKAHLKFPHGAFLSYLGQGFSRILPEHLKDVVRTQTEFLVGTGPFKFKAYTPGVIMEYERNPDYWDQPLPYLDGIKIFILSQEAKLSAFLGDRLDVMGGSRIGIYTGEEMQRIAEEEPSAVFYLKPSLVLRGQWFNFAKEGAWNDVRVRRAMTLVVDYPGTTMAAVGTPDLQKFGGLLYPGSIWANPIPEVEALMGIDKAYEERVAEAKQLMADAGYADGFEAELMVRNTALYKNPAIFAADLWKKHLGIELKIATPETAILFERRDTGDFELMWEAIATAIGDPEEIVGKFFYSESPLNYGNYNNPAVDALYEEIVRESDTQKRIEQARELEALLLKDATFIPFHWHAHGVAMKSYVKGYVFHPLYSNLDMGRVWMDK